MKPSSANNPEHIHFIGCGGAGMGPLALIMAARGVRVSGSDLVENKFTRMLRCAGAEVHSGHDAANLPGSATRVVYSSAVGGGNPELALARRRGLPVLRRGEMLAGLAASYRRPVAVSGSHGKTTITAMLAHIVRGAGIDCGYMIGGKLNSGDSSAAGDGDIFITEVDESDGTHVCIRPWLGVVPNVEDDHAWSVGGEEQLFENFRRFGAQCRKLVYFDLPAPRRIFAGHPDAVTLNPDEPSFDPVGFGGFLGQDAALAVAAAAELGIEPGEARRILRSFPGVARRMTLHSAGPARTVIEDYAHHPAELKCSLELLRRRYPEHHLRVIFQPHRYARLEKYLDDFAALLKTADSVFIAPVFAAWVETGRIGSAQLAEKIGPKAVALDGGWNEQADRVLRDAPPAPLLLAVIGAGDVDRIIPELVNARDVLICP